MDFHGVIWTRRSAGPVKMGDLLVSPRETRFSYTGEFLGLGLDEPGLSLLSAPRLFGRTSVIFPAREQVPLHPRLLALIPGEGRNNIQRRIYAAALARRPAPPAPGFETDCELLLAAGHNGIGHLDVFRDDRQAEVYYQRGTAVPPPAAATRSRFWHALRDEVALDIEELDVAAIAELLGPTPSAGGMIPKLLVAIPDEATWTGAFAGPGAQIIDGQRYVDTILKIEPSEYRGVAELEALCLEVHRECGFDVPRSWRTSVDGLELLAIERFDRTPEGLPVPMESLFSVFATGRRTFNTNQDTDLAEMGGWIERLGSVVNMDVRAVQREIFLRLCFSVCTGNGDMHLQNLSLLGGPTGVRLAPVYDPAPMRAWPRHDVRFAVPLDFDDAVGGFGENLIEVGTHYGLLRSQAQQVVDEALSGTERFAERVMALEGVPLERRERLAATVQKERALLARAIDKTPDQDDGPDYG